MTHSKNAAQICAFGGWIRKERKKTEREKETETIFI